MKKKLLTTCLHSSILQKLNYYYLIFVFTKYLIFDTILPQIFIFLASTHLRARIFGAIFINQAVKKLNSIHKIDNVNSQPVFERNIFLQFNRIFWIFSTLNWILIKKPNFFSSNHYTMCDFHDFGLTWKCQKMCFGWLHDYLKD